MTIEKAIEILIAWKKTNYEPPLADEINALNLAIEALKRIRDTREKRLWANVNSLPGETKEGGG